MSRHTLVRGALATAMGIALTAGALAPLAAPAVADTAPAPEVVIPAASTMLRDAKPYLAERSEFHQADAVGTNGTFSTDPSVGSVVWTRYSDARTFKITKPSTAFTYVFGTGTDALAYVRTGQVELRAGDGTSRVHQLPAGMASTKVYGTTAVAYKTIVRPDGTKTSERHVFSLRADGTTPELTVTGLTADAPLGAAIAGDTTGLVLQGQVRDGKRRHGIVDPTTGKVVTVTPPMPESYAHVKLSPKYLVAYSTDPRNHKALVASRTDPSAPLVEVSVNTGYAKPLHQIAVVGDWLVYGHNGFPVVQAVPIAGGTSITLVGGSTSALGTGPNGTAVAIGGDPGDWALRRIVADAAGKPVVKTVKKLMRPGRIQRLALAQGKLSVVDDSDLSQRLLAYVRDLSTSGTPTYSGRTQLTGQEQTCAAADTACSRYLAVGDGRFVHKESVSETTDRIVIAGYYFDTAAPERVDVPKGSTVTEVSGRYLIYTAPSAPGKQYVVRTKDAKVIEERAAGAAALWGSVLWTAGAENGAVTAKDLATGTTVETVATGAPCVPQELQVVGRWVYWNCGANGPAGVYDRTAKSSVTVPSGESLLADGYVVTHDKAAGKLVLTGTDAAKPVTRIVGTLADTGVSQRNIRWSVDRFGGHLAYADTAHRVHVVPTGIEPQPLYLVDSSFAPRVETSVESGPWVTLRFSRPASSWNASMRNDGDGTVHEVGRGQERRGYYTGTVTGLEGDANGLDIPAGSYTWIVTAQPADGVGPALRYTDVRTTVLPVGQNAWHNYRPLQPARVMDTLNGIGVAKAKVGAGESVRFSVTGTGGVPSAGVTAVALHVKATNATAATSIRVNQAETAVPAVSHFTVPAGKTVADLVIVPAWNGYVQIRNQAGTVDLVADVAGYYTVDEGDRYQPLNPTRVMDTRSGLGVPKAKVKAGSTLTLPVTGRGGVPGTGVTAVALNVTASNATASTVVSVVPKAGITTWSGPGHLNVDPAQALSNLVVVPVVDGKIHFSNRSGEVDLVGDIAGYYTDTGEGSLFRAVPYTRIMDTRSGWRVPKAKVGPGGTVTLDVVHAPEHAKAVVLNVTAANATTATSVSVYPYGATRNKAYNVTSPAGKVVANLVIVPVVDGKATFYNSAGTVDLIADIAGFYAE